MVNYICDQISFITSKCETQSGKKNEKCRILHPISLWQDISAALVVLGVDVTAIAQLKTETMDPDTEKHYQQLLKEWKKDEDNMKDKLDRMEGIN